MEEKENADDKIEAVKMETQQKPEETKEQKKMYEEYVVKNGDTLAGICNEKYGSLIKMKEICNINNINNADYIAPGQKLYLP